VSLIGQIEGSGTLWSAQSHSLCISSWYHCPLLVLKSMRHCMRPTLFSCICVQEIGCASFMCSFLGTHRSMIQICLWLVQGINQYHLMVCTITLVVHFLLVKLIHLLILRSMSLYYETLPLIRTWKHIIIELMLSDQKEWSWKVLAFFLVRLHQLYGDMCVSNYMRLSLNWSCCDHVCL
jgi:hypothetical protein